MTKNTLKWLETEYCGRADVSIQPVLINDVVILYTLFDNKGYNYVFSSIYAIHLYLSGHGGRYAFTCESEEDLIEYLENF